MGEALTADTNDPVRIEYDRLAPRYDRRWARYVSKSNLLALETVSPAEGETVLDVGCGTGRLLEMLAERRRRLTLTGIDLSPGMLQVARNRLGDRAWLGLADARHLPFADASFDWVVSSSMFHYLPYPGQALREWRRVLKPTGRLRLVDWSSDYRTIRLLNGVLQRFNQAHARTWNERELARLLNDERFTLTTIEQRRIDLFWGLIAITASLAGSGHDGAQAVELANDAQGR